MQMINLTVLQEALQQVEAGISVPTDDVNAYLLRNLIQPIRLGEMRTYGDVDFSQFEDYELRDACRYCEEWDRMEYQLHQCRDRIGKLQAQAAKRRAFC